jgi:hypothetical protein
MVHCAGCHRSFTISGYTLHVQRTGSSACISAYHAQLGNLDDVDEERDDVEVFSGDFFGDYQDADFDWPDDEQEPVEGM